MCLTFSDCLINIFIVALDHEDLHIVFHILKILFLTCMLPLNLSGLWAESPSSSFVFGLLIVNVLTIHAE